MKNNLDVRMFFRYAILIAMCFFCAPMTLANIKESDKNQSQEMKLNLIKNIEANLKMPKGSPDLQHYVRYYTWQVVNRKRLIIAVYNYEGSPGRIELVQPDNLPYIEDGGCDVVELNYSIKTKKILSLLCHGVG